MSSFTMTLAEMLELKPNAMSEDEWVGLHAYPIFDANYRAGLNTKIKNHFLYQEIGFETIEYFRHRMQVKLSNVMPAYNELYKTTLLEIDPLSTINIKTLADSTGEQASDGKTDSETITNVDSNARNVASNFPQMMLAGNSDYATSGADSNSQTDSNGSTSEESNATSTTTATSESTTTGYQGHSVALLQAARAAIINVDLMLLNDLDDLFMIVWRNGDDYAANKGWIY